MKVKTSELIDAALDWAVAMCEGKDNAWALYCVKRGGLPYSTSWEYGGPIIEREGIELTMPRLITRDTWCATRIEGSSVSEEYGPTPLIAAMRCFVTSRLGDEVDVPDELKGE